MAMRAIPALYIALLNVLDVAVSREHVPLVLLLVGVPELGGLRVQGARTVHISVRDFCKQKKWGGGHILVGLTEQALQTEQHALHIIHSTPLVLEDVEADAA